MEESVFKIGNDHESTAFQSIAAGNTFCEAMELVSEYSFDRLCLILSLFAGAFTKDRGWKTWATERLGLISSPP